MMKTKTGKAEEGTPLPKGDRDCENCTRTAAGVSPFKLEKILVPVDFSDCSQKALQYAIPFARQFKAQMIFLHVLPLHYAAGREFEVGNYDPLIEGGGALEDRKATGDVDPGACAGQDSNQG